MSMNDARVRLRHMLDAAHEVVSFTTGHEQKDLENNQMLLRAITMSCGIIGEAASRVDETLRAQYRVIPWQQIIGMRNFLFHEYFRVDHGILWNTATISVPELIPQLEAILHQLDTEADNRDE